MYARDQSVEGCSCESHRFDELGIWGSKSTGSTRTANLYEGTSSCPPGQSVVERGSKPIKSAYIGAPTTEPFVYCRPIPQVVAAPPPAPRINVQTTVSPVLQTEVSPQISPIFAQMQDSPGSQQAATTTQYKPGGMTAEGGGTTGPGGGGESAALMELLRVQSEQAAARQMEDTQARNRERRERLARERRDIDYRAEREARDDKLRAQELEMRTLDAERRAAEQAGRDEQAEQLRQQYEAQRLEWESTQATPSQLVSIQPTGRPIPIEVPAPVTELPPTDAKAPIPLPLIALGAAVLAGGIYYATKGKRK